MGTQVFMSKKQRAQMRERRKKKHNPAAVQGDTQDKDNTDDNNAANQEETTTPPLEQSLKRPRSEMEGEDVDTSNTNNNNNNNNNNSTKNTLDIKSQLIDGKLYVLIPMSLADKDIKKFRKDARRQLRAQGTMDDDTEVVFAPMEELPESFRKRKRAKQFPSIKELLQTKQQLEVVRKEEEKIQQKKDLVPEAVRAKYIALDCEMVGIGSDGKKSALARVSIVDWNLDVVLDTFVKVPIRVTDFRTHVSGVEPKHLKNNQAMDVEKCRDKVAEILKGKILVGHALANDFKALMLNHPKGDIRDTAKYRPFQRFGNNKWRARKLRDLVKENLKGREDFQKGEHDSVQDARATMEVFQLVRTQWEKELASKSSK